MILGNHDKSLVKLDDLFESIDLIKEVKFKKNVFSFLQDDFDVVMCHYPLKSWNNKCNGSMQLYGHVHNNAPFIDESDDLCLNVGLDNPICNYRLLSLEDVYRIYLNKLNGIQPKKYSDVITNKNKNYIR